MPNLTHKSREYKKFVTDGSCRTIRFNGTAVFKALNTSLTSVLGTMSELAAFIGCITIRCGEIIAYKNLHCHLYISNDNYIGALLDFDPWAPSYCVLSRLAVSDSL